MTYPYAKAMPDRPPGRQKHGDPRTEDNYGFLRSLTGNQLADVNARVVWRDHTKKTKASGCLIFGFHGETPASNGYRWIIRDGVCRAMTDAELHRPLSRWDAADVMRWRRGKSKHSARPRTINQLYAYVRRNGGTCIVELKDRLFRVKWICQQLLEDAHRNNHAPWFKILANMAFLREKSTAMMLAEVAGVNGQVAIIFGTHVAGRGNRVSAGQSIIRTWPPAVRDNVRIW